MAAVIRYASKTHSGTAAAAWMATHLGIMERSVITVKVNFAACIPHNTFMFRMIA